MSLMDSALGVAQANSSTRAKQIGELSRDLAALLGRREGMQERAGALATMLTSAKSRQAKQPEMIDYLQQLQELAHRKSVGVYEELLTAIINDVLPGQRKARLDLRSERGLPALDIEIEKDGRSESILEGSGGSLVNIVSAGLRIIALARSGNAPFLLLDEADCWLKPTRVAQFASVIGEIAKDIGIQVLMVSHHEAQFFDGFARIARLARRGGKLEASILSDAPPDPSAGEGDLFGHADPGAPQAGAGKRIRSLRLVNYMSHEDTLIALAPGVTCITGENDIGKSAVAAALRSLFYGDCSDHAVRHGAQSCKVIAEFDNGEQLSMEHFLKKSPKRFWRFTAPGIETALMDGSPRSGAPDWLPEVYKITKLEGLDVHFTNQKMPVFLLDEPPAKRASILSMGRESDHLQTMIALNRQQATDDASLIREGEKEHARLERALRQSDGALELEASLGRLGEVHEELSANEAFLNRLEATLRRKTELDRIVGVQVPEALGLAPIILGTDALSRQIPRLAELRARSQVRAPEPLGAAPLLAPCEAGQRMLVRLRRCRALQELRLPEPLPAPPDLVATAAGWRLLGALKKSRRALPSLPDALPAAPEILSTHNLRAALAAFERLRAHEATIRLATERCDLRETQIAERARQLDALSGGHCPLCKHPMRVEELIKGGSHAAHEH